MLAKELGGLDEVQCYLIEHAEKFLAEHGRMMVGWDEILRNNLRPTSVAISYRGQRGAIEAANRGYDAVMSPGEIIYFDWYQANPHTQPRAMSGFSPIKKMYSFEPVPDTPERAAANESLVKGEYVAPDSVEHIRPNAASHIIGVQGCTWAEFIGTPEHLEYMIFPRLLAIAELGWTPRERRLWADFRRRVNSQIPRLLARGVNAFTLSNDVEITARIVREGRKARVTLDTEKYPAEVRYTLDGSEPTATSPKYEAPLRIKQNAEVKAVAVRPTGNSRIFSEKIDFNKATAKPVTLKVAPSRGYDFNGGPELTDGLSGNDNYKTGRWLGFQGKDLDAVIDLKEPTEFSKVSFNTNVVKGDWIMGAAGVTVKVSDDGQNFKEVASKVIPSLGKDDKDGLYPQEISFDPVKARYVEVIIKSDKLPTWHGGAGNPAFLFVDEINLQ